MEQNRKYYILGIIVLLLIIYFYTLGGWQGLLISSGIIVALTLILMKMELFNRNTKIWTYVKELGFEKKKGMSYYTWEKNYKGYKVQITEPGAILEENREDYIYNTIDIFYRRNIFRNNVIIRGKLPLTKGVAITRKEKNIRSHKSIKITGLEKNHLSCRSENATTAKKFLKPAIINKIVSFEKEHNIGSMLKSTVGVPILLFNEKGIFFAHLHYTAKKETLQSIITHLTDIMEAAKQSKS